MKLRQDTKTAEATGMSAAGQSSIKLWEHGSLRSDTPAEAGGHSSSLATSSHSRYSIVEDYIIVQQVI